MGDLTDLPVIFERQRAAFLRGAPDYGHRMLALAKLRDKLRECQEELLRLVAEDFGGRAREETLMLELFPLYDQIRHTRKHLRSWMERSEVGSTWFLRPSRVFVQYQPLGVMGVIGSWNYPILLSLSPVVGAIAAGNHVMIKPSEVTPRSASAISTLIRDSFPEEYVKCVTGGPDVGKAFCELPFDHLLFTGATETGRSVMTAAAANLTPVTLELGGKSPVIIHESYPLEKATCRIMTGKLYNSGQTCIAPDYLLLPAGREAAFEEYARKCVASMYPDFPASADYTRIVNTSHYQRLSELVEDAAARGARVVTLGRAGGETSSESRVFPPMLVFEPTESMMLMQQEIFGPVLPVVSYRTLEEAIAFVNARPRPLALYYFDENSQRVDDMLQRTLSGGVTINDCIFHIAQHDLPFGGVGPSGMGHYHGFDGFASFSKKRGVMVQRRWAVTSLFRPPYGARVRRVLDAAVRLARLGK